MRVSILSKKGNIVVALWVCGLATCIWYTARLTVPSTCSNDRDFYRNRLTAPNSSLTSKRYFLSVYAIFRNEETLIREWVEHYLREGVDHFFLIDHGPSTDQTRFMVRNEEQAGLITFWTFLDRVAGAQVRGYRQFFSAVQAESDWVIMADLDEFAVSRRFPNVTLRRLFATEFRQLDYVMIPDVYFGSSGHKVQPLTVVCNFCQRADYDRPNQPAFLQPSLVKYAVRTSQVVGDELHVNDCNTVKGSARVDGLHLLPVGSETRFPFPSDRFPLTEPEIRNAYILHYHYRILAEDWYLRVRATRGNVFSGNLTQGLWSKDNWLRERNDYDRHYNFLNDTFLRDKTPYCNMQAP